jgi:hypothetical protein
MADKTARTIEARGFRVEHGALILLPPLGAPRPTPPRPASRSKILTTRKDDQS